MTTGFSKMEVTGDINKNSFNEVQGKEIEQCQKLL